MDFRKKDIGANEPSNVAGPTSVDTTTASAPTLNQKITRRALLHSAAAACATSAMIYAGLAHGSGTTEEDDPVLVPPPSPPTRPWLMTLPSKIKFCEHSTLSPAPTKAANPLGEAGRDDHLFWDEVTTSSKYVGQDYDFSEYQYELFTVEMKNWRFHPDYPDQPHWGYQDDPDIADWSGDELAKINPSVAMKAHYGKPVLCRMHNKLPLDHEGFGTPEITTHLHNLHCESMSDGFTGDYYSSQIYGPTITKPGGFRDHFYINLKAGFTDLKKWPDGKGDPTEALGTLWYHDHTENFTAPNVAHGLAGFYLLFDERDNGDENAELHKCISDKDTLRQPLCLPSGEFDYPLSFGDRRFDDQGYLTFDQMSPEGTMGDKIAVNGKIEPVWNVKRRRYRIRLLDVGPSKYYDLAIVDENNIIQPFIHIANDGNLLEKPLLNTQSVRIAVAERADIIMDFNIPGAFDAKSPQPKVLYIVDRMIHTSTRKPDKVQAPGQRIVKIVIDPHEVNDPSVVLTKDTILRPLPEKFYLTEDELKNVPVRRWEFSRTGGYWTVNDKIFDITKKSAELELGAAEIWEIVNPSGGWMHPIHIHFEEGRILSKIVDGQNVPIPPHERGRKDVYLLEANSTTRIYMQFRDMKGKYMMHCHNVIHEDHAMMIRWDIV